MVLLRLERNVGFTVVLVGAQRKNIGCTRESRVSRALGNKKKAMVLHWFWLGFKEKAMALQWLCLGTKQKRKQWFYTGVAQGPKKKPWFYIGFV